MPKYPNIVWSLTVTEKLDKATQMAAKQRGVTWDEFVRWAVSEAIQMHYMLGGDVPE